MSVFVSFLRGINVSGRRPVNMRDLVNRLEKAGFDDTHYYLQSGNIITSGGDDSAEKVSGKVREVILEMGEEVEAISVSSGTLAKWSSEHPLKDDSDDDLSHYHVTLLYDSPAIDPAELKLPLGPGEKVTFQWGHVFLYCPNGYGRTKLHTGYFEKKLGVRATTRNWKTISKLRKMTEI